MTGIENWNYPAFHAAAAHLREAGHEVMSPAENFNGDQSLPWDTYLRTALRQVTLAEAIAVLPGWANSKGAALEVAVAAALGMAILDAESLTPAFTAIPGKSETVLEEAQRLVMGDRDDNYGHPLQDFQRTGRMWAVILDIPEVTAEQVALCMVALKISRECYQPKRDNRTDGAGYLLCLDRIVEERRLRGEVKGSA
jgi:hypothetical protein